MEPSNQGVQLSNFNFNVYFEILAGYLTPRCLQIFHRDIQETTDHFTNKS